MSTRTIFKSATSTPYAAQDVLAAVLAEEMVIPSKTVYLIAPWVSNVVVFDNSIGQFDGLNPEWGRRKIRLVEVLAAVAQNNTRLVICTKPDPHNRPFIQRLTDLVRESGVSDRCRITQSQSLHTKGLATERAVISGSMNFTINGISLNDEIVTVSFDPHTVAQAHMELSVYEQ
jgi:hypothetical protein